MLAPGEWAHSAHYTKGLVLMVRRRVRLIGFSLALTALAVFLLMAAATCSHLSPVSNRFGPGHAVSPAPESPPPAAEVPAHWGPLPDVFDLDGRIDVSRSVSQDETVTSLGWIADINDQTDTTSDRDYSVEVDGTALTLRVYEPGEYAYAVYGQAIGADPKPLQTLIASEVCDYGGGRDDDIPLCYYVGFADYTIGSWRWFGPFGDVDVLITVNSGTLKSRFKSPSDNYYFAVLASNGSKAASALPADGLVAEFPIDFSARVASAEDEDPGGLTVQQVVTTVDPTLDTEPAIVTGLTATANEAGVTLAWDENADTNVDMYQVLRDDLDDAIAPELLQGVIAPNVTYTDTTGIPGKLYEYRVRARNVYYYGGASTANAIRRLAAPFVSASNGSSQDLIRVQWATVNGAVNGYRIYRADTPTGTPTNIAEVDSATLSYDDLEPLLGQEYWYWVQAQGEDEDGTLGGPDRGIRLQLNPLQAVATDGDFPDRVDIAWGADTTPGLEAYRVYRSDDDSGTNLVMLGEVLPATTNYSYTAGDGCPWSTPYWYSVASVISSVESLRGEGSWGQRGLATPQGVTTSQGTNALQVAVSWTAVNYATRYRIYRSTLPADPTPLQVGEVTAPQTSFNNTPPGWGATEGTHYYYYVASLYGGPDTERSAYSAPAEGWRGIGVPQNVSASDGTYSDRVIVTWNTMAQATGYRIYRDGGYLYQVASPTTAYSDTTAIAGTDYSYQVSAFMADGEGAKSTANTGFAGQTSNAPSNLSATTVSSSQIDLSWTDNSSNETGFKIERKTGSGGTWGQIDTVGTGATGYNDTGLAAGTTYYYRVRAYSPVGNSAYSNEDSDTTLAPPTYSVSGTVTKSTGGGLQGVALTLTTGGYSATTNSSGAYTITTVPNGNYTLTPSLSGWSFNPTSQSVTVSSGNVTGKNFTATSTGEWHLATVDSAGGVGYYTSLVIVNGNPAISYWDDSSGDLKYVRASEANGSSWGSPITVDSSGNAGHYTSLAVVNGYPAISYQDYTNWDLKYVRAVNADGSAWDVPVNVDSADRVGYYTSLAVVDGYPAISYKYVTNGELKYVRATDANGSIWGSLITVDSGMGGFGGGTSLVVVNGYPAISYLDGGFHLKYVWASDTTGGSWGTPVTVAVATGEYNSLAVVNGYPAISYTDYNLKYVRASDASGGSWGTPITVDSAEEVGEYASLAVVNGNPAISYYDNINIDLKYTRATDANGTSWNTYTVDSAGHVGEYTSLCVVNGNPAISYYDGTNGDLKFAVFY